MAEENEKDVAEGGDAPKKKGGNLGVLIGLIVGILVIQIGVAIFVARDISSAGTHPFTVKRGCS